MTAPAMLGPRIAYSPADAGDQVGVSQRFIQNAIADGDLPVHYVGRLPRIFHEDLVAWFLSLPTERRAS